MYLSHTVTSFLGRRDVDYETIGHRHTLTSHQTADEAHVRCGQLAKGVLFCDDEDYILAVVPASTRVDANALSELLGQRALTLAGEDEVSLMFPDCEVGAIPPLGTAYGIDTVVDAELLVQDDVYFEGGDHQHLVHVRGTDFRRLMAGVPRGVISEEGRAMRWA